jgi:predicted nucleotidyltransferase
MLPVTIMVKKIKSVKPIELNEAYNRALTFFFSYPNIEITLNALSSKLKISKTTAKKTITRLIDEGFLTRTIFGKTWIIKCNQNSAYNYSRKVAFNLSMVFEAYLNGLREDVFAQVRNPKAVILFGSYRKGDDIETSDIDIAAEVLDEKGTGIIELGRIAEFGYRKNVAVNLHVFCRKNIDSNLIANIANGIILEGFLEVRP